MRRRSGAAGLRAVAAAGCARCPNGCARRRSQDRRAPQDRPTRCACPWNPGVLQKSATAPRTDGLRAAARCSGRTTRTDAGCPRRWAGSRWRYRCDPLSSAAAISSCGSGAASSLVPGASRRSVAISSGRKRDSPMSLRCIRNVLRACKGSNTSDSFRASSSVASALCTACARRSARGVGATPAAVSARTARRRARRRRRARPWLAAGCDRSSSLRRPAHTARAPDCVKEAQQVEVQVLDIHSMHVPYPVHCIDG
jgi:hypothetical protein